MDRMTVNVLDQSWVLASDTTMVFEWVNRKGMYWDVPLDWLTVLHSDSLTVMV